MERNKLDESQVLIKEIREMLSPETKREDLSIENIFDTSDQQISTYLSELYEEVLNNKNINQDIKNPTLYYNKITEAAALIQNQNSMIKRYIRAKIQSEAFGAMNPTIQDGQQIRYSEEYQHLLKMKDQLQEKYKQERMHQYQKVNKLIEKTRKYRNYENVHDSLPINKVESLVGRQGVDFEVLQSPEKTVKSYKIPISPGTQVREQPEKIIKKKKNGGGFLLNDQPNQKKDGSNLTSNMKMYLSLVEKQKPPEIIEVQTLQETQDNHMKNTKKGQSQKISSLLIRSPNFFNAFKGFLEEILQRTELDDTDNQKAVSFTNLEQQIKRKDSVKKFMYPKKQVGLKDMVQNTSTNVSALSIKYDTKCLSLLPKEPSQSIVSRSNIGLLSSGKIKKIVNKRIGDSNKYHLKQCILSGNYLYYSDEQSSDIESSKSKIKNQPLSFVQAILDLEKMKKIEVTLEQLEFSHAKKQQGNVFQSKSTEIEMVTVRGKDRNFYFERSYGQGSELVEELNLNKLKRMHRINCLLSMRENRNMEEFIMGKQQTLDMSEQYLKHTNESPKQGFRKNFIEILLQIFPKRKNTNHLNFQNCKLTLPELTKILHQVSHHIPKLLTINFSRTKLDSKVFGEILKLVRKCNHTITLNLTGCEIDDDILSSNLVILSAVMNKIHTLNFSKNKQITDKGVTELAKCLSSKVSEVKELNLSETNICHLQTIAEVIKYSHNLTLLKVNKCKIKCRDLSRISQEFEAYIKTNQLSDKNIVIEMKGNQSIKSAGEVDKILKTTCHKYEMDVDLSQNRDRALLSKYVCVEFI